MTYGRPPMAAGHPDVIMPSAIDDEYLLQDGEGVQPPDQPSRMVAFVYSILLTNILEEVLLTFYHRPDARLYLDSFPSEALSRLLTLEAKLHQFRTTVPGMFQSENQYKHQNEPWHSHVVLQASLLRNRYARFPP